MEDQKEEQINQPIDVPETQDFTKDEPVSEVANLTDSVIATDVIKEPNGYIAPPQQEMTEAEYVANLADRIHKSSFAITKVAHKDYVKLVRDGFIDNATKTLKANAAKIVIDDRPDASTGTYWEVTDVTQA